MKTTIIRFESTNPDNRNGIQIVEKGDGAGRKVGDTRKFDGYAEAWKIVEIRPGLDIAVELEDAK